MSESSSDEETTGRAMLPQDLLDMIQSFDGIKVVSDNAKRPPARESTKDPRYQQHADSNHQPSSQRRYSRYSSLRNRSAASAASRNRQPEVIVPPLVNGKCRWDDSTPASDSTMGTDAGTPMEKRQLYRSSSEESNDLSSSYEGVIKSSMSPNLPVRRSSNDLLMDSANLIDLFDDEEILECESDESDESESYDGSVESQEYDLPSSTTTETDGEAPITSTIVTTPTTAPHIIISNPTTSQDPSLPPKRPKREAHEANE